MKDSKAKNRPVTKKVDLHDSPGDQQKLENEELEMEIPDVKDIPGQEFIHVPNMDEFSDTTVSSADEEGETVWAEPEEEVKEEGTEDSSNVTSLEKQMLQASADDMLTKDELQLRRASLDERDEDGDQLNEKTSASAISGSDLDVPGADDDNADESLGEEDEENNPYSLGGDDQSINEERSGT
jgi:hypothetical protein